jgi:hypothetical protein
MSHFNFPRAELAEKVIVSFKTGLSSSISFSAPHSKGKTQFLLNDIPAAAGNDFFIVYLSISSNLDNPAKAMISDLENALGSLQSKPAKFFRSLFKNKSIEGSLKSEFGTSKLMLAGNPVKASDEELDAMTRLVTQIGDKSKKPVIIIIDEIQHLLTATKFWPIASTLRTIFDKQNGAIKTIFTGSSQAHMRLLTKDKQSQFYNFSTNIEFPDLGDDFVSLHHNI